MNLHADYRCGVVAGVETCALPMGLVKPNTVVLIVDDDSHVRQSIADVLGMEGYEPRPVPSADAAWNEIVLGRNPAVIILDLWLPGMTSVELLRRLRTSDATGTPVLLLSGSPPAMEIEADVDAVCMKPIDATSLVRAVDKLARRARRPRQAPRRPSGALRICR
jgi:DNA-binding response OmpR family regulator